MSAVPTNLLQNSEIVRLKFLRRKTKATAIDNKYGARVVTEVTREFVARE